MGDCGCETVVLESSDLMLELSEGRARSRMVLDWRCLLLVSYSCHPIHELRRP